MFLYKFWKSFSFLTQGASFIDYNGIVLGWSDMMNFMQNGTPYWSLQWIVQSQKIITRLRQAAIALDLFYGMH